MKDIVLYYGHLVSDLTEVEGIKITPIAIRNEEYLIAYDSLILYPNEKGYVVLINMSYGDYLLEIKLRKRFLETNINPKFRFSVRNDIPVHLDNEHYEVIAVIDDKYYICRLKD